MDRSIITVTVSSDHELISSRSNVTVKSNPDMNLFGSLPSYWFTVIFTAISLPPSPLPDYLYVSLPPSLSLSLSKTAAASAPLTLEKRARKVRSSYSLNSSLLWETPTQVSYGLIFICIYLCVYSLSKAVVLSFPQDRPKWLNWIEYNINIMTGRVIK